MLRPMNSRLFTFSGGGVGEWLVTEQRPVVGEPLPLVSRLRVTSGEASVVSDAVWQLCGVTSNQRYVTRAEQSELSLKQQAIGRTSCNRAALIPIRKNESWWALPQDERNAIIANSRHIPIGLRYLPAIARRLHHCRDIAQAAPFDFLTWFDYTEADARAFEELVGALRESEEWRFVDREVDLRLAR